MKTTETYTKQEVDQKIIELNRNGIVHIGDFKFKSVECQFGYAPCFECQSKFFFDKRICQVCIALDYSHIGEKSRYLLEQVIEKKDDP